MDYSGLYYLNSCYSYLKAYNSECNPKKVVENIMKSTFVSGMQTIVTKEEDFLGLFIINIYFKK